MTEYGRIHTDGSRSGGQPLHSDVERVARALAQADGIEICSDATYALSSYGRKAQAALAAMRQPTQSDALQADALDFGNELIFACAGLRHEPIDTEAIFSITWDGFPYDVTISAAKGQSK